MASALETALLTSAESLSRERVIWPKLGPEGSPDILMGEGGKVLVEETGEGGGEFISVMKFNMMGTISKY